MQYMLNQKMLNTNNIFGKNQIQFLKIYICDSDRKVKKIASKKNCWKKTKKKFKLLSNKILHYQNIHHIFPFTLSMVPVL